MPTRPQDAVSPFFSTGSIQTLTSNSAINHNRQRQSSKLIEPTGVYRLPNGQLIISHECQ